MNRYQKKYISRTGNHIVIEIKDKSERKKLEQSRFSRITSFASQWSQVLTLMVVVFGYFYTVIPVFQKEKLSEDNARLELENDGIKKSIERSQAEMTLKEESFKRLESEYSIKKEEIDRLNHEYGMVVASLKISKNELNKKTEKINIVERQIYDVEKEYMQGKRKLPGEFIAIFKSQITYEIFKRDESKDIAEQLKTYFPDPLTQGNKNLEQLRDRIKESTSDINRDALERMATDYEKGLRKNEALLSCNSPDYKKWEVSFIDSFSVSMKNMDSCVAHHFRNMTIKNGWSKSYLKSLQNSEFWSNQTSLNKESCATAFDLLMEKIYRERWEHVIDPCMERLKKLSVVVLDGLKADNLKELVDSSPPTEEYIQKEVSSMIANWN